MKPKKKLTPGRRSMAASARDDAFDIAVSLRFGVPVGPPGKSKAQPARSGTPKNVVEKEINRQKRSYHKNSKRAKGK